MFVCPPYPSVFVFFLAFFCKYSSVIGTIFALPLISLFGFLTLVIQLYPFSAWCPLKGHIYLKNIAGDHCRFVQVCVTFQGTPWLKDQFERERYERLETFLKTLDIVGFGMTGILKMIIPYPAWNYMFKVNNRSTRTTCEICSKLTVLTLNIFHILF